MAVTSLRWLAALSATLPIVYADSLPAPTPDIRNDVAVHQRAPAPTGLPVARSLQKRAGEICGYRDGDLSNPFQCANDGAVCKVNSAASAIGCCAPTGCNIWTACLPFTSSAATRTANLDRTLYCSDASKPHCATLVYTNAQYSGWTINSCAEAPTLIAIMDVPSSSVTTTGRIPFTSPEPDDTSTRTRTSPADRTGPTGDIVGGENPQPAQSGPPIGAIVGGVVGGVVFLALVGLLIFFLVRGKNKPLQPAAPMGGAPPAQPMYAPVPQGPQSPNNMSQFPHPHAGFYDGKPPLSASVTPLPQPTGSPPPPMYNQQPFYNQAPAPGAGYPSPPQPVSPQFTGQQPASPQLTGQSQQPSPYQPYAQPAPHQQPPQQNPYAHASELPTQRGDGQLHEVA